VNGGSYRLRQYCHGRRSHQSEGTTEVPVSDRPLSVRRLEWEYLHKILSECNGNISAAACRLGMHRRTLQRKLAKRPY